MTTITKSAGDGAGFSLPARVLVRGLLEAVEALRQAGVSQDSVVELADMAYGHLVFGGQMTMMAFRCGCGDLIVAWDPHFPNGSGPSIVPPLRRMTIPAKTCSVEGCERKHVGRGYCMFYWQRWQRGVDLQAPTRAARDPNRRCSLETCERPYQPRGYCSTHYNRLRKGLDLGPPIRQPWNQPCAVDNCGSAAKVKPESTEAMGRGDDTKDDGQGKANGPGLIPIEGMRAA